MKRCPICDHGPLGPAMRCPNCQSALTYWRNFDAFARAAHQGGLHAWSQNRDAALEMLLRAVIFAPDEAIYLADYGKALAQCGRWDEAIQVLQRSGELAANPEVFVALQAAQRLAAEPKPPESPLPGNVPTGTLPVVEESPAMASGEQPSTAISPSSANPDGQPADSSTTT